MNTKMLFLLTTVILLLVVAAQTTLAWRHNHNLTKNYVPQSNAYDYKEAMLDGSLDVGEVDKLFPKIEALIRYNFTNVITAPVPIRYYKEIGDHSPAYVIDKGSSIHVKRNKDSLLVDVGYGLDSMPTDVKGWRMAYPFITDTGTSNELLYVRLDELSTVARSWINVNEYVVQQGRQSGLTRNGTIQRVTSQVDHRLYDSGVYLSPDLFVSVFSTSSLVLSALSVLTASIWLTKKG